MSDFARAEASPEDLNPPAEEPETPETPEIPDWVDEKFRTAENPVEAQAQAYAEAQKKIHEKNQEPAEGDSESPTPDFQVAADNLREAVAQGNVEEEHIEAFEKLGVPRQFVEQFLAATSKVGEFMASELHAAAGGRESYEEMMKWASTNINQEEQELYNRVMGGDDQALKKKMVASLYDTYQQKGKPRKQVTGKPQAGDGITPYESRQEMMADMANPKYRTDPAFYQRVSARVRISNNL